MRIGHTNKIQCFLFKNFKDRPNCSKIHDDQETQLLRPSEVQTNAFQSLEINSTYLLIIIGLTSTL